MKFQSSIAVTAALLLGFAAWAGPAIQDQADTYAFGDPTSQAPPCGSQLVDVRNVGANTYLTLFNHALMVSEDPRLTGQAVVNVEVIFNNRNGHIGGHGSLVLQPYGYAGTWEADFNINAPNGRSIDIDGLMIVKDSHIVAHGTGVFAGQFFFFEHGLATSPPPYDIPVEDPDGPGGCDFQGEVWTGRILNPNAS